MTSPSNKGDLALPLLEVPKEELEEEEFALDKSLDVDVDEIWRAKDQPKLYAIADLDGPLRSGYESQPMTDFFEEMTDYDDVFELDDY